MVADLEGRVEVEKGHDASVEGRQPAEIGCVTTSKRRS